MSLPNTDKLKEFLLLMADRKCWTDDPEFMVVDYCGGNYDDAYSGGFEDGEARLAQQILQEFYGISPKYIES